MIDTDKFHGQLLGGIVSLGAGAREALYDTSFYGQPRDGRLELNLIEAAYLVYKQRISVSSDGTHLDFEDLICQASRRMDNFEVRYNVFKDLRERGYFVKPGVTDFRVYPRGGRPGTTPSKYFVHVLSERQPVTLASLIRQVETAANVKKDLVMAVVDEESEITFYSARLRSMKGKQGADTPPGRSIRATFLQDRVMVWDKEDAARLHREGFFGKPLDEIRLQLSLIEAAYLQVRQIIKISDITGQVLTPSEFADRARVVESDFPKKLAVYQDLRDAGMVVKTGYKFGSHYRVYRQVDPDKGMLHSEYLVHAMDIDHVIDLPQLSRAIRLAHSVRKQMIFAWESGGTIIYLEMGRMKM